MIALVSHGIPTCVMGFLPTSIGRDKGPYIRGSLLRSWHFCSDMPFINIVCPNCVSHITISLEEGACCFKCTLCNRTGVTNPPPPVTTQPKSNGK
jgi:hypothetical protein